MLHGYRVFYKPIYQMDLSPVRQNNLSEYASVDVGINKTLLTVTDLDMFSNYSLLVGGRSGKGVGKTCEAFGRTAEGSMLSI